MSLHSRISMRATGNLPLSIATSLAIESAIGIHPEIQVASPPILKYKELWINLRTLFRNLTGALDKDTYRAIEPVSLSQVLIEEMIQIQEILKEHSPKTKVVYYLSNYKDIELRYPHATIRRDSTDNQKVYTALMNQTMDRLLKPLMIQQLKTEREINIDVFALKIHSANHSQAMIITHIAYDLVAHKTFSHLSLLESHTGKIKEEAQWYTKYYNNKDLFMFPYREDLVQVLGDNEVFRPGDPTLRKELIAIATKYNWNALVSRDKIRYGIEQLKNPYHREFMKQILV